MSKQSEIQALISLLDEEDENILDNVSQKLVSYGNDVIESLEIAWEDSTDTLIHNRIENLIDEIKFDEVSKELENWISDTSSDLLQGFIIVSKVQYPDIDIDEIENKIEGFKQKIWLELHSFLTPLEQINTFNQMFYEVLGFFGDYKTKPEIGDYCINKLLETKKGNSISLSILYIVLANKLNLKIYGVRLPRHFVLSLQNNFIDDFSLQNSADVIFYINAVTKGTIFERDEITAYLKKVNIEVEESYYSPIDDKYVIEELLVYLKTFYTINKLDIKLGYIERLLKLFK